MSLSVLLSARRNGPINSISGWDGTPCRIAGCNWHGHPEFGGLCSLCGQGWSAQRLEQLHLLAKEAEAEMRARDFEDWDEPGVTLSPQEYDRLRRGVECWVADRLGAPDSFGAMTYVSKLLLESYRLLTPEQARGLWRAVEPTVLDVHDHVDGRARTKFIVLLASFLNSPERWCGIPWNVRQEFWPDENDGCYLGRLAPHKPGPRLLPTYDQMLRVRLEPLRESKLMAAACLRRTTLPKSVIPRIRIARGRPGPDIPPLLVKRIFLWLAPDQVRPREDCCWMVLRSEYDGSNQEWSQFLGNMRRRS